MTTITIIRFDTVSDWLNSLDESYGRAKSAGWDFIITLRGGIDQFGRTDHRKAELYEVAANQIGVSSRTLQNYVSMSRSAVAKIAMDLDLDFSHANAAMGLNEEVARDLLTTAAEQGWEPARIRKEAWAHKNAIASHGIMRSGNGYGGAKNVANGHTTPDADTGNAIVNDAYYDEADGVERGRWMYCPHCGARIEL